MSVFWTGAATFSVNCPHEAEWTSFQTPYSSETASVKVKGKVTVSLLQAVEALRVARGQGSHVT
jgi:hypothetical protein